MKRGSQRGGPMGHRAEHSTDRYVEPKIRGRGVRVGMKSQGRKGGRMSPRKHR